MVAPLMIGELGGAAVLVVIGHHGALAVAGLLLAATTWALTFTLAVPLHRRLNLDHDPAMITRVVQINWLRRPSGLHPRRTGASVRSQMRRFAQIDVFGDGDGDGNPLAVVIDGDGLSAARMQRFASWTNLSETTFLLTPTQPGADYRVRIFTTSRELPFAGHPTLGSAHAWLQANAAAGRDSVVQECRAGLVELRRADRRLAFAAPPLLRSGPLDDATLAEVTATLGIDATDVVDHAWTDNGPGWASVLLDGAERVLAVTPRGRTELDIGVVGLHPDGTPEVRAFVTDAGVSEDPVTGSLNAGVAEWLLDSGRLTAPYVAHQGTALGRHGRIYIDRDPQGTIWVGGQTETRIDGSARL